MKFSIMAVIPIGMKLRMVIAMFSGLRAAEWQSTLEFAINFLERGRTTERLGVVILISTFTWKVAVLTFLHLHGSLLGPGFAFAVVLSSFNHFQL